MSQDEVVDIVNEQGLTIGIVSKKEAHQNGLLHKVVVSEVIDSQGRWLLVKQSSDRQDAGKYVSPMGGHVSAGESNDDALKRETYEELGLAGAYRYELAGTAILNRTVIGRQENHYFVVYKIFSDARPILNQESESFRYLTPDELKIELAERPHHFGQAFHFIVKNIFPELL